MKHTVQILIGKHTISVINPSKVNVIQTFASYEQLIEYCKKQDVNLITIFIDTPVATLHSMDTTGINLWYKYKLKKRLLNDFEEYDMVHLISASEQIIYLRTRVSSFAQAVIDGLIRSNIMIKSIYSSLISILSLPPISQLEQYVVSIPMGAEDCQNILITGKSPQLVQTLKHQEVKGWLEFVTNSKNTPILSWQDLTQSKNWVLWLLTRKIRPTHIKTSLSSDRTRSSYFLYIYLRLAQKIMVRTTALLMLVGGSHMINWKNVLPKLNHIEHEQQRVLEHIQQASQPKVNLTPQQITSYQQFQNSRFPVLDFFEALSETLPKMGKVIEVHLEPHKTKSHHFMVNIGIIPTHQNHNLDAKLKTKFTHRLTITTHSHASQQLLLTFEGHANDFYPIQP